MNHVFIYALKDPRNGAVRYIGKAKDPSFRLHEHCRKAHHRRTYSQRWLSGLKELGVSPALEILDEVPAEKWEFFERAYLKAYREAGARLTNETEGGDGVTMTPEICAKVSVAQTGKKFSSERRAAMSAIRMGTKLSPEHRAKIGTTLRGRNLTQEHREKLRKANLGKKLSLEHREKLRAAKLGKKQTPEHVAARVKNRHYSSEERLARRIAMLGNQHARKKVIS